MRIISGKFKNKILFFPNGNRTRPLKDNVKELQSKLEQSLKSVTPKK